MLFHILITMVRRKKKKKKFNFLTKVGWLETLRQYYDNCVKHILNSVINILKKDKTKKFVWVETQWIDLWWKEASKDEKETLREIIKEKRFEFILGAWCMSDEATPTYSAIIDQVTLG